MCIHWWIQSSYVHNNISLIIYYVYTPFYYNLLPKNRRHSTPTLSGLEDKLRLSWSMKIPFPSLPACPNYFPASLLIKKQSQF